MIKKGTKLFSIFFNKCPRCHEGKLWPHSAYLNLTKGVKMNESCSKCGLVYEQEPGFWYGAMYVGYALTVAIIVATWIAIEVLAPEDLDIFSKIGIMVGAIILLAPYNLFLSRLIWINFFVKYKKSK